MSVLMLPAGMLAGKRFFADGRIDKYQAGRVFRHYDAAFASFGEFAEQLAMLEGVGTALVIRGGVRPEVDITKAIIRRKLLSRKDDLLPSYQEHPIGRSWIMLDLDKHPQPFGKPTNDAEMRSLVEHLFAKAAPASFIGTSYWYQWSSSMGVSGCWDLASIHFWLLTDRPLTDTVLKQWASHDCGCDPSVFNTVQPHFIAKPKFIGMEDPLGECRSGIIRGDHERAVLNYVHVPDEVYRMKREQAAGEHQRVRKAEHGNTYKAINVGRGASGPMKLLAEIGMNGRLHGPIVASAVSWVRCCGDNPDYDSWAEIVCEQIAATWHPEAAQRGSEDELRRIWEWAKSVTTPMNPKAPRVPFELLEKFTEY